MKDQTRSQFINVKCPDCGNAQPIFNRSNTKISCTVCGSTVAIPTGGKAIIKGEIIERIDRI